MACNDDINTMGGNYASSLDVRNLGEGTYTIVVDLYAPDTAPSAFEMEVTFRPVLATGAACDPAGTANRCAGGACVAATMMCP